MKCFKGGAMSTLIMNNDMFRVCDFPHEIINLLNQCASTSQELTLWQNIDGVKKVIQGKLSNIDQENKKLTIILNKDQYPFDFSDKISVYHKSSKRSYLFKTRIDHFKDNFLYLQLPKEIRIFEVREYLRYLFNEDNLRPKIVLSLLSNDHQINTNLTKLTLEVADVSNSGIGLILDKKEINSFDSGVKIVVYQIGDKIFKNSILAKIVYVRPLAIQLDGLKRERFRVGVSLSEEIDINKSIHEISSSLLTIKKTVNTKINNISLSSSESCSIKKLKIEKASTAENKTEDKMKKLPSKKRYF